MRMRVPAGEQEKRLDADGIDSRLFELAWPGRSARLPAFGSVSYQRATLTCRGHAMVL
jgi:predicted NUDIX family NTP pyrophosphohydrolase